MNSLSRFARGLLAAAFGLVFFGDAARPEPRGNATQPLQILANCTHELGHAVSIEFDIGGGFVRVMDHMTLPISHMSETLEGGIMLVARLTHYEMYASIHEAGAVRFRHIPERFDEMTCSSLVRIPDAPPQSEKPAKSDRARERVSMRLIEAE